MIFVQSRTWAYTIEEALTKIEQHPALIGRAVVPRIKVVDSRGKLNWYEWSVLIDE